MKTILIILVAVALGAVEGEEASNSTEAPATTSESDSTAAPATTRPASDVTTAAPVVTTAKACSCNMTALNNATTNTSKCTEYKIVLGCLTSSTSCNTANISAQAALVVKSSNCSLTKTCQCEQTYLGSSRDTKDKQCSTAQKLKTCLEAITLNTDPACDSNIDKSSLMKNTVEPEIKAKCSGATSLYLTSNLSVLCLILIGWLIPK